jgi:hypothetical protein
MILCIGCLVAQRNAKHGFNEIRFPGGALLKQTRIGATRQIRFAACALPAAARTSTISLDASEHSKNVPCRNPDGPPASRRLGDSDPARSSVTRQPRKTAFWLL